jgi:glutamate racemase
VKGNAPLGVFDSGLGGLTVVRALLDALPDERIVYLGDTARIPYGTRSPATVVRYARGCARVLCESNVKALIVACNTVSAVALDVLRAELDLPVIGVVEPGARAAVRAVESLAPRPSGPVKIGVLGTAGTIASGAYPRAVAQISTRFEVLGQAAPLLVPLVEEGWLEGMVPELAVQRYVEPLITAGVGVIVLGCTHYPLLKHTIAQVAYDMSSDPVPVVDSAEATAARVAELLAEQRIAPATGPLSARRLELLVTDLPASFDAAARRFLGSGTPKVTQVDVDLAP